MLTIRSKIHAALFSATLLTSALPAYGHHSFAMFDFAKSITVKGTVKEFQWTNPHVILVVYTDPETDKTPEQWTIELTSPGNLTRTGWTRHSLKAGDRLDVEISPLRDGTHGGAFKKATLSESGAVLSSNLREQERPGLE